ncbi:hypothetical protein F5B17DRAFT_2963 [Nemania serpens]|nr:hypothetical protein F5B17DRAFT_2963 [Nemania serpens]
MFTSQFIIAGSLLALSAVGLAEGRINYAELALIECGINPHPTSISAEESSPSSSTHTLESSTHTPEPSTHTPESSTHTTEPSTHTTEPSTHTTEPSTHTTEPSTHTTEPPPSSSSTWSSLLPESCYSTWEDEEHSTTTLLPHECYTHTSLIPPTSCPKPTCPPPATDQVCPLYIKVSSVTVPCTTDCCPTTTTVLLQTSTDVPCEEAMATETCDPCHIPTEWVTYMTGCAGTPTISITTIITPAF